ncbi:putative transcriptional regulator [Chitinophaga skermanii]|uniref:Putative transcriptional regulator n=1 Tax=Chitinophaga skermanii TaxID=331697 RepID=A0A327QRU0_9BACT|nr:BlaI/MecI/CopY family transcriptional regulator [Chitinophaga skermanii]RAJ06991.1 putative transcriptional regulator [Chitinophaga skermanii]
MEELTKTEERIMQILWQLGHGFVKDIIELMEDPKPPYTTVSSVVRLLEQKQFVTHKAYGKTHEYYPAISKEDYKKNSVQRMVANYFDNNSTNLLSFLLEDKPMNADELDALKKFIDQQNTSK